jgi:uncharacterized membrane protein
MKATPALELMSVDCNDELLPRLVACAAFCLGMALFTIAMGNADGDHSMNSGESP